MAKANKWRMSTKNKSDLKCDFDWQFHKRTSINWVLLLKRPIVEDRIYSYLQTVSMDLINPINGLPLYVHIIYSRLKKSDFRKRQGLKYWTDLISHYSVFILFYNIINTWRYEFIKLNFVNLYLSKKKKKFVNL